MAYSPLVDTDDAPLSGTDRALPVTTAGKFFDVGNHKWQIQGLSYGPFAPNSDGDHLPERDGVQSDFLHLQQLGANAIRLYYPPPVWLLDDAQTYGLRLFIDVPWEKHRCFFEDWSAVETARQKVCLTARTLGMHPAVFAISVANEIPSDVTRFYGHRRVERLIDELIDGVKQEAPDCLATYVNFPTTEFLAAERCDFACFNVYLHDSGKLASYLDRLQHIAGNKPLVLGEYGVDSLRRGEDEQEALIAEHIQAVQRHGVAGSFVFAYTDDWFTGGHQIEDWAFGVTRRDREAKPAAQRLRAMWSNGSAIENREWPRVSVVVCSFNGAATLRACLKSLMELDYPDYEVILVDDGSEDETSEIAADFPQIVYHYQANQGLSVARNVGAALATGDIVAYTDSDCVADEHWLRYLVQAMEDQRVAAIGGPNITPRTDGWVAQCVAVSPGNPSHVMLDDRYAEHVPGCNVAFRRNVLLGLDGFDAQFRQAGDDVDICWRLLDAEISIGYAAGAMVWHHRRSTVGAYLRQQKGYGKSEALVHFKHPQRCGAFGRSSWRGIIYGDGAVGLPLMPETVYHGRFGMAPYQTIYRHNEYGLWSCIMSLEWHLLAVFVLFLATLYWPLACVSAVMWSATCAAAIRHAWKAPLPSGAPWWCRPLAGLLYILQPIVRGWHRQTHLLRNMKLPAATRKDGGAWQPSKRISPTQWDLYWRSDENLGREDLLNRLVPEAQQSGWMGDYDDAWAPWDVKLVGDRWHDIRIRTATEELGWPNRFTRARCMVKSTRFSCVAVTAVLTWTAASVVSGQFWAMSVGAFICAFILVRMIHSRRRCLKAITRLVIHAGRLANLQGVVLTTEAEEERRSQSPSQTTESEAERVESADPTASETMPSQEPIFDTGARSKPFSRIRD